MDAKTKALKQIKKIYIELINDGRLYPGNGINIYDIASEALAKEKE